MCILFLALGQHPHYPVVLCANRDEFHQRPAAPAHFWPDRPELLAGRDLRAQGSWLALNKQGQLAAVTNIRAPALVQPDKRSRGELVLNALDAQWHPEWLLSNSQHYNPFHLLFSQQQRFFHFNSLQQQLWPLAVGIHTISNTTAQQQWPKMARGEQQLQQLLQQKSLSAEALLPLLQDETKATTAALPNTGVTPEWELRLSSIFIRHPDYGTRASTIIRQDQQHIWYFDEFRYDSGGDLSGHSHFQLPG